MTTEERVEKILEEVIKLRIAVATLKVKSGIWGGLSGMVVAIGIILIGMAKK